MKLKAQDTPPLDGGMERHAVFCDSEYIGWVGGLAGKGMNKIDIGFPRQTRQKRT